MTFLSYAPNFEDILLWRALGHVANGTYIDVGAADPLHGSVTQAFYQRGWHGLNLEPAPALHARLCAARPADINLALGAGAMAMPAAPFYDVLDSERSGFLPEQAQASRAAGLEVMQRSVALAPLAQLWRDHVAGTVHFLNVAVNGDEAAVLAGMDWQQCRPWIVLVRSAPGSDQAASAARLAAARYTLAYRDGQKDYYVAEEQAALAGALALPPHDADRFTLYEGHHYAYPLDDWRRRTAAAEQAAAEANAWVKAHEGGWNERLAHAETRLAQALHDLQHTDTVLTGQLRDSNARAEQAATRAAQAEQEAAHGRRAQAELHGIYGSVAWKLSRPIRGMVKLARYGRDAVRQAASRVRHGLARGRARARAAMLAGARRALRGVLARPALTLFLRRQLGRFPRLAGWLRTLAVRSQAPALGAGPDAAPGAELQQLSTSARQVYADLQRAIARSRQP